MLTGRIRSSKSKSLNFFCFPHFTRPELGGKINIGITLDIFASWAVAAGETEKAARLFGTAQAIHNPAGYNLEEVDQKFVDRYIGEARARMGEEAFEAASREGKQMRLKKAIALARETG